MYIWSLERDKFQNTLHEKTVETSEMFGCIRVGWEVGVKVSHNYCFFTSVFLCVIAHASIHLSIKTYHNPNKMWTRTLQSKLKRICLRSYR